MGNYFSSPVLSDPLSYATEVKDDVSQDDWRKYDYVIVGGGAAGCVLAARLSEDRDVTVLLVEAGTSHGSNLFSSIPFTFVKTFHTKIDWSFQTVPQKAAHNRQIDWFRGKVLGGTTAINASIHHQCAPQDFDQWASLGLPGWSYNEIRPYFAKSEGYRPSSDFPEIKTTDRGTSGPWTTGHPPSPLAPVCQAAHEACVNLGIPELGDANTPQGTSGVVDFIANVDASGRRVSTATAYLTPAVLKRPNLTVAINAHVDKILFDQSEGSVRAIGIEISTTPTSPRFRVRATREVVLSAGAVCTPSVLLLSGVGPAADLQKLEIPLVKDLPAGQYLSDHIGSGSLRFRAKPGVTWDYLRNTLSAALALLQWYILGTGPFTTLCVPSAAFIRSGDASLPVIPKSGNGLPVKDMSSAPGVPDTEIIWAPVTVAGPGLEDPRAGSVGMTMLAINLRPESTGSITLKSKDPWMAPVIDPNYFASESDLNVVARGVRFCLQLARTEPLASMLDPRPDSKDTYWAGDIDPDKVTDAELQEFVRANSLPEYHPISSARMGPDPATSVVDAELRVHGIQGLRVADASVFPIQVTGHPLTVIVAIAERAADLMKKARQA